MDVRREVGRVVRESWREMQAENIPFMAGSIAYHAFVSMLPLLLFVLVVLSAVGNEAFTAYLAETTGTFLTPYARRLLVESLDATAAQTGVSVVGLVTLLWGISKIFRGLDVAFSEIYDSHADKTLLGQFENAVVVGVALALAVVAFLVVGAMATLFPSLPYSSVMDLLLLVVGLAVAFFPIYYVFPDVDLTPREVVPGVVVAALGWTALEMLFQGYVSYATRYEVVYGTLGSAFLLLIWLYFSGLVLLLGGVVNAVLAGRTGDTHALDVTDGGSPRTDRNARDGDAHFDDAHPDDLSLSDEYDRLRRSYEELGRDYERLARENQRLREQVERLEVENDRLAADKERLVRENDALARRLTRRRSSVWTRAKRWVVGERK